MKKETRRDVVFYIVNRYLIIVVIVLVDLIYTRVRGAYFFLPNLVSFLSSSRKMEMKLFLCVSFSNGFSPSRRRGSWETVLVLYVVWQRAADDQRAV